MYCPFAAGSVHPVFMGWAHGGGTPVGTAGGAPKAVQALAFWKLGTGNWELGIGNWELGIENLRCPLSQRASSRFSHQPNCDGLPRSWLLEIVQQALRNDLGQGRQSCTLRCLRLREIGSRFGEIDSHQIGLLGLQTHLLLL